MLIKCKRSHENNNCTSFSSSTQIMLAPHLLFLLSPRQCFDHHFSASFHCKTQLLLASSLKSISISSGGWRRRRRITRHTCIRRRLVGQFCLWPTDADQLVQQINLDQSSKYSRSASISHRCAADQPWSVIDGHGQPQWYCSDQYALPWSVCDRMVNGPQSMLQPISDWSRGSTSWVYWLAGYLFPANSSDQFHWLQWLQYVEWEANWPFMIQPVGQLAANKELLLLLLLQSTSILWPLPTH